MEEQVAQELPLEDAAPKAGNIFQLTEIMEGTLQPMVAKVDQKVLCPRFQLSSQELLTELLADQEVVARLLQKQGMEAMQERNQEVVEIQA